MNNYGPYKIILLGDCNVGKTNIINGFSNNKFESSSPVTLISLASW